MNERQQTIRTAIEGNDPLVVEVSREQMAASSLGDLGELVSVATECGLLPQLLGRVSLCFPEYDSDPREAFEVPECRDWMTGIQQQIPYLPLLVDAQKTFQELMLCDIPWTRSPDGSQILPDQDKAMGWTLDCGMISFEFAQALGHPDPKKFAGAFLSSVGLAEIVNDELLEDYARHYAARREEKQDGNNMKN